MQTDTGCRPWEGFQGARDQSICKHKVGSGALVWSASLLPALCACQVYLTPFLPSLASLFSIVIFLLMCQV